ncbi:DnaJ family domain-containing protein [Gordonia sp. NPDC003424]
MIREATERGEFDDLPGMGKPLDLSDADDPDWWVKRKIRDEDLDSSALLPAPLQLRKEAQGFPESLRQIADEQAVRDLLTDFNRRVREAHLSTRAGMPSLITAHTVDVDDMVAAWRELRRH